MRRRLFRVVVFTVLSMGATTSPALSGDAYGNLYDDVGPLAPQNLFEGWYLGGTLGGATVNYDFSPATGEVRSSGILGGVIGGWSWQSGPFVLGVEGDAMFADIDGTRRFNNGLNQASPSIDTMLDLRLRAGYTVTPRVLLFGTFGGAWADASLPVTGPGGGVRERDFFGWSVGGGAEVSLNPNWAARFDYQFTDFDSEPVGYPGGRTTWDPDANTFRGSLIYRF
ncbi:MAG: outer membrane protein [Methyloceanibacter sp.]